jgi:mRNA-degrading endonuclease YafQ of YafQ-DinJ toxin-antitoxin module
MKVSFATSKLEKLANDSVAMAKLVAKQKAHCTADDVQGVFDALAAADSSFDLPNSLRTHPLQGNLKGHFGVDVSKTHRIIFRPDHDGDTEFRIDNHKTIKRIVVTAICVNYH